MNTQSFIFNWRNQFESTLAIEKQLNKILDQVNVINSDENHYRAYWHNIGESAYFNAQFLKALALHDGESIFFHAQGDTHYNNWANLISDALFYMEEYQAGIYYPKVENVEWQSDYLVGLNIPSKHNNIKYIVNGDETVWLIHPSIINYLKQSEFMNFFESNNSGWGWDVTICYLSHFLKMPVIRDSNHNINHPLSRGYNSIVAQTEWLDCLDKFPNQAKSYIDTIRERKDLTYISNMLL